MLSGQVPPVDSSNATRSWSPCIGPRSRRASRPCLTDIDTEYAYPVCSWQPQVPGAHQNPRTGVGRPVGHDGGMHPNIQAVQVALRAAGARGQVQELDDAVHTAAAAAAALGVQVGQIANSL